VKARGVKALVLACWLFVIFNQLFHGVLFIGANVLIGYHFREFWYLLPLLALFHIALEYGWWIETRVMLRAFKLRAG
jgi:hypothetical protein